MKKYLPLLLAILLVIMQKNNGQMPAVYYSVVSNANHESGKNDNEILTERVLNSSFNNVVLNELKTYKTPIGGVEALAGHKALAGQSYRSKKSGDWKSTFTWEVFDGTNYIPASVPPSSTDGVIIIKDTVTIFSDITADEVVVIAGGRLEQYSNFTLADGPGDDLVVYGSWMYASGNLSGTGQAVINTGASWTFAYGSSGKSFTGSVSIINGGTIDWNYGNITCVASNPVITNNGTFLITGNNTFSGGGTIINNSIINKKYSGTSNINSLNSFTNSVTGILKGVGTISITASNYQNNGTISPGSSPGLLTLDGEQPFSSNTILQIEMVNGNSAGIGYDQLLRNSDLTLAGTLNVTSTVNVPIGTYNIIALTSGTISGSFTTVNIPNGTSLKINSTNVQLIVSSILPLNLLSFSGIKQGSNVLLQWQSSNEVNTSLFEIERDGASGFRKIGEVNAINRAGDHRYKMYDEQPLQGSNLYRLKMIDIDGSFTYSAITRVDFIAKEYVRLFPNPAGNELKVINVRPYSLLQIIDASGKIVHQQNIATDEVFTNIQKLSSGNYTLQLSGKTARKSIQFVKQ